MAAKLVVDAYGADKVELVFCDTNTEDEDLHRFLHETRKALGVRGVRLQDGRNIWQVFRDVKYHGNSRVDPCSRVLKRELFLKHIESHYTPEEVTIVFGIGTKEAHRMKTITERWQPYKTSAPLLDRDEIDRETILAILDEMKIKAPRLYDFGFEHNNCGGFCIKTGQKQMALLLSQLPDRYHWHEKQQEDLFVQLGKRHGFIRKVIDGEMKYLSLKEFREFLEAGGAPELYDNAGCGCFV